MIFSFDASRQHNVMCSVQPIHWIYDQQSLQRAVVDSPQCPEFLPVSANPYYTLPTGSQSPYGDQLMVMLESLVECKGHEMSKIVAVSNESFVSYTLN